MILELENICKEYMQGKIPVPVLKNINFSMEEGEYVAIMGPSGSGKTTLMNIVGCLDQATSGRLILDGQKQRVAIARAIVNHPKILLADEPTGALDSHSGEQVMELFQSLNDEGVSILMITHDAEIASMAQRTVEIRDGMMKSKEVAEA